RPINPNNVGLDDAGDGIVGTRDATGGKKLDKAGLDEARNLAISGWCRAQFGARPTKRELNAARTVGLRTGSRQLAIVLPQTEPLNTLRGALNQHLRNRGAVENFNYDGGLQYNAATSASIGSTGAYIIPPETLM